MKRIFIICSISLVIAACGGKKSGNDSSADSLSNANNSATAAESSAAHDTAAGRNGTESTGGTPSSPGAQLIAKYDCLGCHKEHEKLIGPAYADVADKYKSAPAGIVDTLANKVINGGKGNWGDVPMSGHPSISVDDARSMVKYILSLKK